MTEKDREHNSSPRSALVIGMMCEFQEQVEDWNHDKFSLGAMPVTAVKNAWNFALQLTEVYRRRNNFALDLGYCEAMENFPASMALIANDIYISYLDITMPSVVLTDEGKNTLVEALCKLKKLKYLFLNAYFISSTPIEDSIIYVNEFRDISKESIEKTQMWKLTQYCKQIKELKIIENQKNEKQYIPEYISEATLAAISNLKNLLELHLVDILTIGSGASLSIITKGCTKLRTLHLKNVDFYDKQKSIEKCLLYAHNISEISIYQDIELTLELMKNLSNCLRLEKLSLQSLKLTSTDLLEKFAHYLYLMKNLYVFRLITKNIVEFPSMLLDSLNTIYKLKPAFRFLLGNEEHLINNDKINTNIRKEWNNLINLKWPSVHQHIRQHSSSMI